MKVVHINSERAWGGGEAQTRYLIDGLKARGVENILIAQPQSKIAERVRQMEVEVVEIAMHGEWDLRAVLKIVSVLRRTRPDIVQLHTSHAHTLGLLAGRLAGIEPIVATRRMDHKVRGFFSKLKYRKVHHVVAISKVVQRLLIEGGVPSQKTSLIYSAVNCPSPYPEGDLRMELGLEGLGPIIGTVATLGRRKGHRSLFEAIAMLKPRFPGVRLLVVGTGPLEVQLRDSAREQGVEEEVLFLGFRTDIPRVLNTLDVFVLASQSEGLGVSLLEAACGGLPLVGTDVGGIPEIVHDGVTGCLVPPGNSQVLAEKLAYLLDHPAKAAELGRQAQDLIRTEFSVETMVAKYHRLYQSLVRKHGTDAPA